MKRDIFQAIADPTRRAIIALIATHAMTPNAMAMHFEMTRQAVSKHIKVLSESRLVEHTYHGREIYYQLNPKKMKELSDWLEPYRHLWEARFNQLEKVLAKSKTKK